MAKRSVSKFDDRLGELVYELSLNGGADEEVGEAPGTWAGIMRNGKEMADALESDAEFYGLKDDEEDEKALDELQRLAGVILFEDTQGFVTTEIYEDPDVLEERWEEVLDDLSLDEDEEEDG